MSYGKFSFDYVYALDVLSIGEVKMLKLEEGEKRDQVIKHVKILSQELENYLGLNKFLAIYQSQEYLNLYKINEKVWEAVDLAERNEISAKEVADLNTNRYYWKSQLQKKFFDGPMLEQKGRT